ncbi:hypothetical protein KIN20_006270 [Parelaphostrongylus tenuis]|uniref:Uncharacterized protein n=1 Tax=Parelaphostrongylus tenuis TaxID=148309 RepID=A0AAD5MTX0_PARTN|nr:hypothetical protein KIN20_006270 [Parelaphostrongylus tenuis]
MDISGRLINSNVLIRDSYVISLVIYGLFRRYRHHQSRLHFNDTEEALKYHALAKRNHASVLTADALWLARTLRAIIMVGPLKAIREVAQELNTNRMPFAIQSNLERKVERLVQMFTSQFQSTNSHTSHVSEAHRIELMCFSSSSIIPPAHRLPLLQVSYGFLQEKCFTTNAVQEVLLKSSPIPEAPMFMLQK